MESGGTVPPLDTAPPVEPPPQGPPQASGAGDPPEPPAQPAATGRKRRRSGPDAPPPKKRDDLELLQILKNNIEDGKYVLKQYGLDLSKKRAPEGQEYARGRITCQRAIRVQYNPEGGPAGPIQLLDLYIKNEPARADRPTHAKRPYIDQRFFLVQLPPGITVDKRDVLRYVVYPGDPTSTEEGANVPLLIISDKPTRPPSGAAGSAMSGVASDTVTRVDPTTPSLADASNTTTQEPGAGAVADAGADAPSQPIGWPPPSLIRLRKQRAKALGWLMISRKENRMPSPTCRAALVAFGKKLVNPTARSVQEFQSQTRKLFEEVINVQYRPDGKEPLPIQRKKDLYISIFQSSANNSGTLDIRFFLKDCDLPPGVHWEGNYEYEFYDHGPEAPLLVIRDAIPPRPVIQVPAANSQHAAAVREAMQAGNNAGLAALLTASGVGGSRAPSGAAAAAAAALTGGGAGSNNPSPIVYVGSHVPPPTVGSQSGTWPPVPAPPSLPVPMLPPAPELQYPSTMSSTSSTTRTSFSTSLPLLSGTGKAAAAAAATVAAGIGGRLVYRPDHLPASGGNREALWSASEGPSSSSNTGRRVGSLQAAGMVAAAAAGGPAAGGMGGVVAGGVRSNGVCAGGPAAAGVGSTGVGGSGAAPAAAPGAAAGGIRAAGGPASGLQSTRAGTVVQATEPPGYAGGDEDHAGGDGRDVGDDMDMDMSDPAPSPGPLGLQQHQAPGLQQPPPQQQPPTPQQQHQAPPSPQQQQQNQHAPPPPQQQTPPPQQPQAPVPKQMAGPRQQQQAPKPPQAPTQQPTAQALAVPWAEAPSEDNLVAVVGGLLKALEVLGASDEMKWRFWSWAWDAKGLGAWCKRQCMRWRAVAANPSHLEAIRAAFEKLDSDLQQTFPDPPTATPTATPVAEPPPLPTAATAHSSSTTDATTSRDTSGAKAVLSEYITEAADVLAAAGLLSEEQQFRVFDALDLRDVEVGVMQRCVAEVLHPAWLRRDGVGMLWGLLPLVRA